MQQKMKGSLNELKEKMLLVNPAYEQNFEISEYHNTNNVIVKTRYGNCKSTVCNLLKGKIPTIESAINKTEFFINMYKEVYGDKYDFSIFEYHRTHEKSKIICRKHGIFEIRPSNLLFGQNCAKCSRESTTEYNKQYPNGWGSTNWYKKACTSKNFTGFKVYILKFWDDIETFYKIGRTFTSIKKRFIDKRAIKYNYKIVDIYNFPELTQENAFSCIKLEEELHRKSKKYKYVPSNTFDGVQECYSYLEEVEFINNHRSELVGKILDYVYGK